MVKRVLQLIALAWWKKVYSPRFGLFLLPWLIMLAVPALRPILNGHIVGSPLGGVVHPSTPGRYSYDDENLPPLSSQRIAREHPQNLDAQVLPLADQGSSDAALKKYDELIEQHPDQIWLIAERLVHTNFREGVVSSGAAPPIGVAPGAPRTAPPAPGAPPAPPPPPPPGAAAAGEEKLPPGYGKKGAAIPGLAQPVWWFDNEEEVDDVFVSPPTPVYGPGPAPPAAPRAGVGPGGAAPPAVKHPLPETWHQSMRIARLGSRLEPNNAFFDWMVMCGLLVAHRDGEALSVLKAAARKPYFDAHKRHTAASNIRAFELVRPLLFEEKMDVAGGQFSFVFDYSMWRLVTWQVVNLQRQGNHARALQIFGDMLSFGSLVRTNRDDIAIMGMGGSEYFFGPVVRSVPEGKARPPRNGTTRNIRNFYVRQFGAYARRLGCADLARQAAGEALAEAQDSRRRQAREYSHWTLGQIFPREQEERLWIVSNLMLGFCFTIMLLMGLRAALYLLLWDGAMRSATLRARDLRITVMAFCAITAGFTIFVMWPRAGVWGTGTFSEAVFEVLILPYPALLLLGPLLCAAGTVWHHRVQIFGPRPPEPGFQAASVPPSLMPLFMTTVSWAILVVTVLNLIGALVVFMQPTNSMTIPLPPALIENAWTTTTTVDYRQLVANGALFLAVCYSGWLARWRWMAPPDLKPIAHYGLRWHLNSLSQWMIVLAFAYLLVAIASLPSRHAAEATLENFLLHGRADNLATAPFQQGARQ